MEYYENKLCLTYEELTAGDDPVIKYDTLRKNITRGNIDVAGRGGGEGAYALVVYSSLPGKYQRRWVERNGDPAEQARRLIVAERVKTDHEAREWFERFEYDLNGVRTRLPRTLVDEYTLNASVLNELARDQQKKERYVKQYNNSKRDLWADTLALSEELREAYPHTLPASLNRLRERMKAYRKDGYASLLSGKLGNSSTLKINAAMTRRLIALKRSRVPIYTDREIFDEINRIAAEKGWKRIDSRGSLAKWFARPEIEPLWWDAVHGELSAHQRYGRKHKTYLPVCRDALWYGDGTKLNLFYRDDEGKVRTTMVYEVIDAYSEVFLGYYISDHEDFEAQYNAYRMAIQVAGHKPIEIVHDNQGGHKKLEKNPDTGDAGFFDKICHVHRPTAPYSGQSKTIENAFGRFQKEVLAKDWRFTGMNITTKSASSRPNLEFIEANKDQLYTLEELMARYSEARKAWNNAKHPAYDKSRLECYQASVNENTDVVTPHDMVDIFWVWTRRPVTFTDQGITIQIGKAKRQYEVYAEAGKPDHEWRRRNTYREFHVKYDPCDLRSIRLYWQDNAGQLRFERVAEPYMVIHRALQDQTEGEAAFIRQEQAANTEDRIIRQEIAKEIEYAYNVAPEQHGLSTPKLKGVTKEVQEEVNRRTRRYAQDPEEYQVGRATKRTSNLTWDQVTDNTVDMRRVAGKL